MKSVLLAHHLSRNDFRRRTKCLRAVRLDRKRRVWESVLSLYFAHASPALILRNRSRVTYPADAARFAGCEAGHFVIFFFLWGRHGVVLSNGLRKRQQLLFFSNRILAFLRTLLLRLRAVLQAKRLHFLFVTAELHQRVP